MKKQIAALALLGVTPQLWAQTYHLVWADEFNGTKLSKNWVIEETATPYNNELQCYAKNNVYLEGGNLVLEAKRQSRAGKKFTSGRVNTNGKVSFTHGAVRARIFLPKVSNGLWPAYWMMGSNTAAWPKNGEIDILEGGEKHAIANGTQERAINSAIHWGENPGSHQQDYSVYTHNSTLTGEWHIFTCVWDEQTVRCFMDDSATPYYTFPIARKGTAGNYLQQAMHVLFDLAVGGDFPGILDPEKITALPEKTSSAKMLIDYVRVYQEPGKKNVKAVQNDAEGVAEKEISYPEYKAPEAAAATVAAPLTGNSAVATGNSAVSAAPTAASTVATLQQSKPAGNVITRTVTDGTDPIIGASVSIKGKPVGAITDIDGNFSIEAPEGTDLVFSYIGHDPVTMKAKKGMSVLIKENSKALQEVVVTALGIKRDRKALGYGVGEVKGEELTKAKETNVVNSLAGKVAGLVVSQTAGGASGSTRVILRGSTEMTGNNQPLYVIDGVPLDNTNFGSAGTSGGFDLGDGISSINPDDIENMSILKGPAASALYGSRASHGVILITTKRAAKDSYSLEYNGSFTIDTQLAKWNDIQQVYGMGSNGTYSIDAIANTNKSWGPKADGGNMLDYFDGVSRPYKIIPNNTSGFFRTGFTATNSAILGVNSGKTGVRFTFTDMRNRDIVPNTNMSRDIFNVHANTSINKFDFDLSANYTREHVKNRPALGDSKSNIGKNLMTLATTYDQNWLRTYQDANGNYANWNGMDPYNVNPYWDIYKNSNNSNKDQFRFSGKAIYNVNKHLKVQATLGADLNWFTFEDYKAPTTPGFESGRLQQSDFKNRMYNFELLGIYTNTWGKFDFTGTLGGNIYKVNNKTTITTAQDMKMKDVKALMSFNEISLEPASYRKQINSIYGAVNLGWNHLLYLDATLRGDQSSTLPIQHNVYIYPSFSGSFVFSELLKQYDLLPYGKLRMSYAQVGSDTDPYQLSLVYNKSRFTYPNYTIAYINNNVIPNKNLKPTKTNSYEIGLETKFFKNRMGLDITYYSQRSKNQIMGMASSWGTGYTYRLINAGEIDNRGIEISLNSRPIQTKDFSWDLNVNFSKNSNKVKKLVDGMDMFELEKATWLDVSVVAKVGENYGSIVGPDFQRNANGDILIDKTTGLPLYDKSNHVLGNASWDWTGGLTTTFTYKNLSLSALFDVKVGADLYSMSARASYESGKAKGTLAGREEWNRSEEERLAAGVAKGDWTATGGFIAPGVIDNGDGTYSENTIYVNPEDYWMSVTRNAPSMFVYDNSYIKCREITLSYKLPQSILGSWIKSMSVSFVARNPFILWKNIPNIDPDSNYNNTTGMGLEYGSLPSRKSYGINLNIKF